VDGRDSQHTAPTRRVEDRFDEWRITLG